MNKYTIVSVKSAYTESVINNDSLSSNNSIKSIENVVAVFSKQKDTIITYTFNSENFQQSPDKRQFTSKKIDKSNRVFLSEFYQDTVKVSFNEANKITINKDIYSVNEPYYIFLKQKILEDGSILDFVNLIKEGYGDYCESFNPLLDYKWEKTKPIVEHEILNVLVNNINYQSAEDDIITWKIIYNNSNANGKHFNKTFIKEDKKYSIYHTEYDNERYHLSKNVFNNNKTSLDSVSASWESYAQSMEKYQVEYQRNQLKLDVVKTIKEPKDVNEILRLLKIN